MKSHEQLNLFIVFFIFFVVQTMPRTSATSPEEPAQNGSLFEEEDEAFFMETDFEDPELNKTEKVGSTSSFLNEDMTLDLDANITTTPEADDVQADIVSDEESPDMSPRASNDTSPNASLLDKDALKDRKQLRPRLQQSCLDVGAPCDELLCARLCCTGWYQNQQCAVFPTTKEHQKSFNNHAYTDNGNYATKWILIVLATMAMVTLCLVACIFKQLKRRRDTKKNLNEKCESVYPQQAASGSSGKCNRDFHLCMKNERQPSEELRYNSSDSYTSNSYPSDNEYEF